MRRARGDCRKCRQITKEDVQCCCILHLGLSGMALSGSQDVEMDSASIAIDSAPIAMDSASIAVDPALSLRELALKSIKSRRKPHSDYILPPRPPPAEATFQLDYGQEEVSPPRDTPQTPVVPAPKSPAPKPPVVTPQAVSLPKPPAVSEPRLTPVPDNQARKEGEISNEEEVEPPTEPLKTPSTVPVPRGPRLDAVCLNPTTFGFLAIAATFV